MLLDRSEDSGGRLSPVRFLDPQLFAAAVEEAKPLGLRLS
jgi:hypothetical protein